MHRPALRNLHDQRATCRRFRSLHPEDAEVQRRFDAVGTDLRHQVRQRVQLRGIEALRCPIVRYAENETSAASVGERGECIREIVAPRT